MDIKDLICMELGLVEFKEQVVSQEISKILIKSNNCIDIIHGLDIDLHLKSIHSGILML